jgi:hypothetical protein
MKAKIFYDSLFAFQDKNLKNAHVKIEFASDNDIITLYISRYNFVCFFKNAAFYISATETKINNFNESEYNQKQKRRI